MIQAIDSPETTSPFLEKIEGLSKGWRIGIFIISIVLILAAYVIVFWLPKSQAAKGLKNEYEDLVKRLDVSKKNAQEYERIKAEREKARAAFNTAKRKLPEKEEIPTLLTQISESGQVVGLEFLQFAPKKEVPKDFYAEIPVSIKIKGGFHDVVLFFDRVAHLSRIVQTHNISMTPAKGGDITTDCTAVTYKFVDKPVEDKSKKKKRK